MAKQLITTDGYHELGVKANLGGYHRGANSRTELRSYHFEEAAKDICFYWQRVQRQKNRSEFKILGSKSELKFRNFLLPC